LVSLNEKIIRKYSLAFIKVYIFYIIVYMATSTGLLDIIGHPIGNDFSLFYSTSHELLLGNYTGVYDVATLNAVEAEIFNDPNFPLLPFGYPPVYFLFIYLLATVPYLIALFLWWSITISTYLRIVYKITPHPYTMGIVLAFPGTFQTFICGQNGFISASLLGSGLLLLETNPVLAGVIMSLLIYKPHLGFLLAVALIAGRKWITLLSASLSAIILIVCTIALFGIESWRAFFETLQLFTNWLEEGDTQWQLMPTIFPMARLLGFDISHAYGIQAAVSTATIGAVVWTWRRAKGPLAYIVLICGIFLVTPYAFNYDLVILGLAIAWYGKEGIHRGWLPGEQMVLLLAWIMPLISVPIVFITHMQVVPITVTALLILTIRRLVVFHRREYA